MAYVLDNQMVTGMHMPKESMSNSAHNTSSRDQMELESELSRLRIEMEHIKGKFASKSYECNKLRNQLKQCTLEIDQYKQILSSISHGNGSIKPIVNLASIGSQNTNNIQNQSVSKTKETKSKAKKARVNSNCSCCCDADKPYICDWVNCGKRFRQKPHLEAHRNIHTGRRFVCDWPNCGKSFVRKYNLVEHQKLHSAVNPNMCTYPDCGKVFSSKYSLMRHQNAQHNLNL